MNTKREAKEISGYNALKVQAAEQLCNTLCEEMAGKNTYIYMYTDAYLELQKLYLWK